MPILPKDFQRFSSEGTQVSPQYIKKTPGIETLAEQVLDCFRYSPDDTCDTLQDNLESLCQSSQRHRLLRGFIHILEGHLQFETPMDVSPVELRQALFIRAAQLSGEQIQNTAWRENAVCDVAKTFGVEPGQIDDLMYADLKSQRKILAFDDLSTDALIAEYNLALAKSLLLYAKSLSFTIDLQEGHASRLRRLFRHLRFHNLLFEAQNVTETTWQFKVDGPSAVLPQPQKYALSLANFLPTLYTFDNWCGNASISLDGRSQKVWQLKSDDFPPPDSPLPERIPEEVNRLTERLCTLAPEWRLILTPPILQLNPQAVWIPDFTIEHRQTLARAHVEVLGFWRADYLNRRLKDLKMAPPNLVLVLSDKLKTDKQALAQTNLSIVSYKVTPNPQAVLKAIQACAIIE